MPVPFLNQTTGQLEYFNEADLTPEAMPLLQARGLRQATPEDVANRERTLEYSTVGQQALAQAERIVRGATLGQVEGIGSDEEIRARAEVSQDVSPVLSAAADFVPDVALGALTGGAAALATGAGRAAARGAVGLGARALLGAAAEAAPVAALAGEAVAGGAVTASQQAFQEHRQFFHENPVEDATNTLLWSGIGGVLGGAPMAFKHIRAAGKASKAAAEVADDAELMAARAAGEADAVPLDIPITVEKPSPKQVDIVNLVNDMAKRANDMAKRASQEAERKAGVDKRARDLVNDLINPKPRDLDIPLDIELPSGASSSTTGVPLTSDEGTNAAYAAANGLEARPILPKVQEILDRQRARTGTDGSVRLGSPEQGSSFEAPLNDIRVPDEEGYLEAATPEKAKEYQAEINEVASGAFVGKSLEDLGALPLNEAHELSKVESFKNIDSFRETGVLPGKTDQTRGSLPSLSVNADGEAYLSNGRHRWTAARETGQEFVVANVKKYDADGNTIWDYVGPVRVNAKAGTAAKIPAVEKAITDRLVKLKPDSLEHKQLSRTLERMRARRSQAGIAEVGGPNFTPGDVLSSPLGNVAMSGAGAIAGGQATGDQKGILAGGALGLGASLLLGRRGGSAAAHVAEGQLAKQAERGVAKAERNAVRSHADDTVRKAAKGEEPLGQLDGYLRDSKLAQYQPEIIEQATKEMRNDLNELNRLSQGIRERAVKQEDVAKNIADNLPAQQAKARDIAIAGQRLAGSIMADARALGERSGKRPQYFSKTAQDLVSSLIERTASIAKMKDGAEIFNALDDMKRVVDTTKKALERGAKKRTSDPLRYQELIPRVQEFADNLRASLEDVPTFGRAGEMQKAYNVTYHQKWYPAKSVFEDAVFRRTGEDYRAFDVLDAWESKVTNLLENQGTGERRMVGDMLGALKEMAEQRAKYGTASKGETDRIVGLVDKIERTFKLADDANAAKGRLETLTPVGQVVGSGIGAAVGGLPGAILGGGIAKGAAELATGKYRRAFMAMRGATEETIERSVDDWIKVSKGRAMAPGGKGPRFPKLELAPEDRSLLKTARRMGVTFGFAEFLGDNKDPQSAFTTKRDALMDDEGFVNRFADEFGDLATEEPQVYAVAAGKAGEVRKFLLDRLPSSVAVSMARPNGYPPTNEAIEDWSVYWNAATNPRSVVQSMSRGDIRPQEVETLRTLYRPLYEKLQATLIDRISNANNMSDDLDDQFVMRMSLLFDLDGAGSPAFSHRAANVARQVAPPQQAQPSEPFAPKAGVRVSPSNVAITGPTYGSLG